MRIAVLGAAASALLGGTLAVTPLTSVSTPLPATGTCGKGGAVCERVASVLMPETPKPSGPAVRARGRAAGRGARTVLRGLQRDRARRAVRTWRCARQPSARCPGWAARESACGGAPAAALPGVGVPDVGRVPGLPDAAAILPELPGALDSAAGIYAAPAAANTAMSVVYGVVGVGGQRRGRGHRRREHGHQCSP